MMIQVEVITINSIYDKYFYINDHPEVVNLGMYGTNAIEILAVCCMKSNIIALVDVELAFCGKLGMNDCFGTP